MKKGFNFCFIVTASITCHFFSNMHAAEAMKKLLCTVKCVALLPSYLKFTEDIDYSTGELEVIINERFIDLPILIPTKNIMLWKKAMAQKIKRATQEKRYIPYATAKIQEGIFLKNITIDDYLKKLPENLKESEKDRLADIFTENSITIENLMHEIFLENKIWFRDIDPKYYQRRVTYVIGQKETLRAELRRLLDTL